MRLSDKAFEEIEERVVRRIARLMYIVEIKQARRLGLSEKNQWSIRDAYRNLVDIDEIDGWLDEHGRL